MEPPFLVFRDKTPGGVELVTSIPLAELFNMQRAARQLMWMGLNGDPQTKAKAQQSIEAVFAMALSPDPDKRGRAVVSAYLLREALTEARAAQSQAPQRQPQTVQAPQQSVNGEVNVDFEAKARAQYEQYEAKKKATEVAKEEGA